jgi:hypothetical protein
MPPAYAQKMAKFKALKGSAKGGDNRKRRAEIVKRVMKEKGLPLIQASKYVKEHKLYP